MSALRGELIDDVARLAELAPQWTELAAVNRQPMSMPEWLLAWLRHLAPDHILLRAVAVHDGEALIGLAPMFVEADGRGQVHGRVDYRTVGAPFQPRLNPMAAPGREAEVARLIAEVLAQAHPQVDGLALDFHTVASGWPAALARAWPTAVRPLRVQETIYPAPVVDLTVAGDFEEWLAGKSATYRGEMRRLRRKFAHAGGTLRMSTPETVREDVATLIRLHCQRWAGRGISSIAAQQREAQAFFTDVGEAYVADGRFRLYVLELDGVPVAANIAAAAGGELAGHNGGWDETYAKLAPSVLCTLAEVEDGFARGDQRLDLGVGDQPYKLRVANGDDPVARTLLLVPNAHLPANLARMTPGFARRRVSAAVKRARDEEPVERLRALRRG